jgi:hypothetical protein
MASGAAGDDGSPWPHNQGHGPEGKEGAAASLPCSEATTEKMDDGDAESVEFGGGGELGRHSGGQGRNSSKTTRTRSWCKGCSMSDGRNT